MSRRIYQTTLFTVIIIQTKLALASGSGGMPWEEPLANIADSIMGPVLRSGLIIAVVILGLSLAFFEVGGFFRRLIMIVIGLCIATSAVSWALSFFGFSGGLAFPITGVF